MALNKGFNDEIKALNAEPIQGVAAGDLGTAVLLSQAKNLDSPLRMFATATPNSVLNFSASVTVMGDGASKQVPPISNVGLPAFAASTVNLSTGATSGGTFTLNGAAFATAWSGLTFTNNLFRRFAFAIQASGTMAAASSPEVSTQAALQDFGSLLAGIGGLPVGYIDCQYVTAGATYKTAGASSTTIQNGGIFRLPLGSGGGSGTGNANTITSILREELLDSPYGFVTPNVIATSGQALISSLTGATYDLATNTIKYTANAQVSVSTNLVDVTEYLSQGLDVGSLDLSVFWDLGSTTTTFSVPSGFTYEVSRDGGVNYYTMTMSQVGTTNVFRGNVVFGTSTTTEVTFTNLASVTAGTQSNQDLNITTQQQIAQSFTVPANQNWILPTVTLNVVKTGSPTGFLYVSVIRNTTTSSTVPSTALVDLLAQSAAVNIASVTTGALAVTLPSAVLQGGTAGANYSIVVSSDAGYKAVFAGGTKLQFVQNTSSALESIYNGTTWSSAGTFSLVYTLAGRQTDLRVRITSAGSPTYPCGLDGYGLFYSLTSSGLVGQTKKTQRFSFNSVTDNLSTFTLNFTPDPDLLTCYWVEGGQAFKVPAFSLAGLVATFPASTFNQAGVSQTITLIFDQNSGGASDSAPANTTLLAFNHLGSTGGEDKSVSGRGIILRNAAGILREIALDANDKIIIMTVP